MLKIANETFSATASEELSPLCGSVPADRLHRNKLLDSLPISDYDRLAPFLQLVELEAGQFLNERTTHQHYVYFPLSVVLSLQYVLEDGSSSEIAGVGPEGMFGASLLMGDASVLTRALVQSAGCAYRSAATDITREFTRGATFQRLVMRQMQDLFVQMAQISTCNRSHNVEQRLCRWLLGIIERSASSEVIATHDQLASVLGVRRESVTAAARRLQDEGAICYRRGRIAVLARRELEQRTCACHGALRQLYEPTVTLHRSPAPRLISGLRLGLASASKPAAHLRSAYSTQAATL